MHVLTVYCSDFGSGLCMHGGDEEQSGRKGQLESADPVKGGI